jgi:hypothetical protein
MRHPSRPRHRAWPAVAALALALAGPAAHAQTAPPAPGQTQADRELTQQLRLTARDMTDLERHLDSEAPEWPRADAAIAGAQERLAALPVPALYHGALKQAQSALAQARQAAEARDPAQARTRLRQAVEAMNAITPGLDAPTQPAPQPPRADTPAKVPTFGDADTAVPATHVATLIGTAVVGATGDEMGRIRNFLAEKDGRVRAAVVEWGGIAGLGERRSVVPIERMQLGPASVSGLARLDMTRDELADMPRYDPDTLADLARQRGWGEALRPVR